MQPKTELRLASSLNQLSGLDRIRRIYRPDNTIACPRRQCTNNQSLQGTIDACSFRAHRDLVLDVAETQQDDDGNADGDEESMGDILHGKIRDHGNESALQQDISTNMWIW
jgi:hypothetical protein